MFARQTLDLHFDCFNFLNQPTFYMSPAHPASVNHHTTTCPSPREGWGTFNRY
jgi:hypothetical protein